MVTDYRSFRNIGVAVITLPQRLQQHAIETQFGRIAETLDADGHAVVTCSGLRAVSAEQPVPPGKVETEVAVGFCADDRMMHAVHVRRHHQQAHDAVDWRRHAHVAVVEHRRGIQQRLEYQHRQRRCTEQGDDRELDEQGKQDLDRMEAHAGRHVDVEIGVVHAVQPP